MYNKFKNILDRIPDILASDDDLEKSFEKSVIEFKSIVDFDNAYICYLNAGCANIQFRMTYGDNTPVRTEDSAVNFPEILKTKLYDTSVFTFDENSAFFNALKLKKTNSCFLLAKLNIRETVFGFMVVTRPANIPFTKDDETAAKAFSSLVSYSIKD